MLRWLVFILSITCVDQVIGQQLGLSDPIIRDTSKAKTEMESWSLRLFSSRKTYTMAVRSRATDERIRYIPNNLYSVGVGITYKFVALDVGFNIKPRKERATRRFDADLTFAFGRNVLEIGYQRYRGFDMRTDEGMDIGFRDDIKSQLLGFNFYRTLPGRQLSLKALSAGMQVYKKSTVLMTYGGYWFWDQIRADSSIIPASEAEFFNDRAKVDFASQFSFGGMVGIAYSLVLPLDMFVFATASPGLGFNTGKLEADRRYSSPLFPSGRLNIRAAIGYAGPKIYVVASLSGDFNFAPWGDDQVYRYSKSKIKVAIGYRLFNTRCSITGYQWSNDDRAIDRERYPSSYHRL